MAILAPHRLPRPFTRTLALALLVVGLALVSQARVAPAARAQAPDGFDDLDDAEVAMIVVGLDTNLLRISTDSSRYAIGDAIRFCYTVPAPGPIAIYDYQPNGVVTTLISGFDDGRGDCLFGTVTPPAGRECMRIRYFLEGGSISRATCFDVLGDGPVTGTPPTGGTPPPPTGGVPQAATSAGLTADYRFQGTLASAVGNAPALTNIGTGNRFATERVNGSDRTVLRFQAGDGLSLAPASSVVASTTYTVVLLFRFENVDGYRRVLDTKNATVDRGLYVRSGYLNFYSDAQGMDETVPANTYVQVALTRTGTGQIAGYVNGVRQFSFADTGGNGTVSADNVLRFFKDDGSENGTGAVARIRTYNRALSADEVAALDR